MCYKKLFPSFQSYGVHRRFSVWTMCLYSSKSPRATSTQISQIDGLALYRLTISVDWNWCIWDTMWRNQLSSDVVSWQVGAAWPAAWDRWAPLVYRLLSEGNSTWSDGTQRKYFSVIQYVSAGCLQQVSACKHFPCKHMLPPQRVLLKSS